MSKRILANKNNYVFGEVKLISKTIISQNMHLQKNANKNKDQVINYLKHFYCKVITIGV